MKSFTVKRSQWWRGKEYGWLRLNNHKQCCLGFCARQILGYKAKEILNVADITSLRTEELYEEKGLGDFTFDLEQKLVEINDALDGETVSVFDKPYVINSKTRESLIKKLFASIKIKVIFKD